MFWIGLFVGIAIMGMVVMATLAVSFHVFDVDRDEFLKTVVNRTGTINVANED